MTQGVQDNRDFYRIQDMAILEFEPIESELLNADQVEFPLLVTPQFHLLNELQVIDADNSAVLRNIAEKERDIATYLKSISQKIELLGRALVESSEDVEELIPQDVTLSEGGISFNNEKPIKLNTHLALKLVLLPSYIGLLLFGRVVNCNEHIKGDYLINLVFERLAENDRQLIARHVLQHQAKERRDTMDNGQDNG